MMWTLITALISILVVLYTVWRRKIAVRQLDPVLERVADLCVREDVGEAPKEVAKRVARDAIHWRTPFGATWNYVRYGAAQGRVHSKLKSEYGEDALNEIYAIAKGAMFVNFRMAPITWMLCLQVILVVSLFRTHGSTPNGSGGFDAMGRDLEGSWLKAVH